MITGTKEYLDDLAKNYQCPEHGPKLTVAWHAGENSYVLRCGAGHFPEEVAPAKTAIQEYKAGERKAVGPPLDLLPHTDLGTGQTLTDYQLLALADYADRYGLDAYRGHVMMMYGKPYIGLDGYLYHAHKSHIAYQLRSRPLNPEERKTYLIANNDHAWICSVSLPVDGQSFEGLGIVTAGEMVALSPKNHSQLRSPVVAAHPWQLAQKRAEWQALRRAFPIGAEQEEGAAAEDISPVPQPSPDEISKLAEEAKELFE